MKSLWRTSLAMMLMTVIAAAVAGWAGVQYGLSRTEDVTELDAVLHRDLNLTPEQDRQIHALEAEFAATRTELQARMRAANRDLAEAITERHSYDDRARDAVARLHVAMSSLQEKTIQHVLAMRAVLTPAQARDFDAKVSEALGAGSS
ncbi:periplasmic heavy metal sensor [Reyranella sp.]|uniref:Spy/CpxP family protein refolding chaperone n=1 Tax=Reyranella sp. TaxID=1929291 RepID=UPI002F92C31D